MASDLNVANYFLNRVDRDSGDAITSLKLLKLVYYAQAWSMVFRGQPLFNEKVQAWVNGPATYSVWKEYERYENNSIPEKNVLDEDVFQSDELEILNLVWDVYGELSASKLWKLSHSEAPWLNARQGLEANEPSQNPISLEDMKIYYGDFGGFLEGKPYIENRATEVDKNKTILTIFLKNGNQNQVDLKDLGNYISENKGNIEYEQSDMPVEGVDLLF